MHLQTILILSIFFICDAKMPRYKPHTQPNVLPSNSNPQSLRLIQNENKNDKTSQIVNEYRTRHRRESFDSKSYESGLIWAHTERLDEHGDVILRWVNTDSSITFRLEARTRGYVGLGFNTVGNMRGADLVVAWVDDRHGNAQILDCHGLAFDDRAVADEVQNYELISGYQNDTHTTVEFRRQLDTCDRQDFIIGEDTTQVIWALGPDGSDGQLPTHINSGSRPLRFLQPLSKPDSIPLKHWDVKINNLKIPHVMATLFWCKVFKAPDLPRKHHIIGYEPLIDSRPIKDGKPVQEKNSLSPVHHMVLYECAEDHDKRQWNEWAQSSNDGFFGPNRPAELANCVTPIAAWAMGSKGEFLPENVGIPLGDKGGVSYYMLEVHYDNQALHEVLDNSGIRIHFTPSLRPHDAGLLGAGIGVSALHVIPPKQREYKTIGLCSPECTNNTMPEEGINIVSVLLHAHGTANKISLKHIRGNYELPRISEENSYDARYQQSRIVPGGRKFFRGDTLITECTYDTTSRDKPILGGYSATQEMCLSFVLYYPRTELAGCYSMTPVVEFFETFGVKEFYGLSMIQVENIFLFSGIDGLSPELEAIMREHSNQETAMQGDDQGVGLMKGLVIKEPSEFRNKTFMAHLNEMPWYEPLFTDKIQKTLYSSWHMTFCKRRDDSWGAAPSSHSWTVDSILIYISSTALRSAIGFSNSSGNFRTKCLDTTCSAIIYPIQIHNYPNFTELTSNEASEKTCNYKSVILPSINSTSSGYINKMSAILVVCIFTIIAR